MLTQGKALRPSTSQTSSKLPLLDFSSYGASGGVFCQKLLFSRTLVRGRGQLVVAVSIISQRGTLSPLCLRCCHARLFLALLPWLLRTAIPDKVSVLTTPQAQAFLPPSVNFLIGSPSFSSCRTTCYCHANCSCNYRIQIHRVVV